MVNAKRKKIPAKTKQARRWCFTAYWNSGENPVLRCRSIGRKCLADDSGIRYLLFGREFCPNTGRRHLQGYIEFKTPWRLSRLQTLFGSVKPHFESAQGTASENIKYCSKEGDIEEFGTPAKKAQGHRSDLEEIRGNIAAGISDIQLAEQNFSQWCQYRRAFGEYRNLLRSSQPRQLDGVYLLWGRAGSGKTRFAYEHGEATGGVWLSSDPQLKWFDGYTGQKVAILDDFRGDCSVSWFLRLLDRYPLQVQLKGGWTTWNPSCIFITSNLPYTEWFQSLDMESLSAVERRFKRVVHLTNRFDNWEDQREIIEAKLDGNEL